MTVVVRLPEDVHTTAKQTGAIHGRSATEMISNVWRAYLAENRDELAAEFEEVAALLRSGNSEALAEFTSRSVVERAEEAAEEIRKK
jgi:ATP-dependent helicase YprA (DUF1998 family)